MFNDGYLSVAEQFYNLPDDAPTAEIMVDAKSICVDHHTDFIGDVLYRTFIFDDGSRLTVGDNGYMGMEC